MLTLQNCSPPVSQSYCGSAPICQVFPILIGRIKILLPKTLIGALAFKGLPTEIPDLVSGQIQMIEILEFDERLTGNL